MKTKLKVGDKSSYCKKCEQEYDDEKANALHYHCPICGEEMTEREEPKSKCCNAPIETEGIGDFRDNDEVCTQCFICEKCKKPCDIKRKLDNRIDWERELKKRVREEEKKWKDHIINEVIPKAILKGAKEERGKCAKLAGELADRNESDDMNIVRDAILNQ